MIQQLFQHLKKIFELKDILSLKSGVHECNSLEPKGENILKVKADLLIGLDKNDTLKIKEVDDMILKIRSLINETNQFQLKIIKENETTTMSVRKKKYVN